MQSLHYNVAIIGAGVAGLTAALVLAKQGLKVVVFDSQGPEKRSFGECVHGNIAPILAKLDLLEQFEQAGHFALQGYQIEWDGAGEYERHLLASPHGTGWILNRSEFDKTLLLQAQQAGVEVFWHARLHDLKWQGKKWDLVIKHNDGTHSTVTADFAVDASGRARVLTRKLGVSEKKADTLIACCSYLAHKTPHSMFAKKAIIQSDPHGWWYLVPFSSTQSSLCYFTDTDLATPKSPNVLLEMAKEHTALAQYLMTCEPDKTTPFKIVPAYSSSIDRYFGKRWLALGDAACSYDPLSSYGVTSALGSAFYGASAMLKYFNGEPEYLGVYEQLMQARFLDFLTRKNTEYSKVSHYQSAFWQRRQVA
ncbi:NAD(P)/FAD-dependent oxidoreductase [Pseudoalteromonas luteoviolacea]|uniref:FAD-binding domain-containing protein n=1 Tax=Pseudoalteromonas luteoviolacea S4054 TaxID=1129367 RepID=A0A0F6AED5_9GAMM|nr:NAD(P)/FAD-dependent oxidoreductase [Pseudoalteromonas luteoviolacea]AOT08138.1 hypothetical protein S4054249_09905 [Pseudoalteromonas luteoviolacea]AOT13055.1 hypothetical protein S40542_09905 [Pseudoalteromonas luteoviolacea]AOT17967.1 hypothetical protein S4054_09900 [Pseudoalteromonas luteoviolacea]KKE84528.1 hypothetical protein N479_08880 [Pseudoalteromonas luteoviolacea S4054]KZN69497.1 hypothetical protein N481_22155 [Pseudoalteromonas luteoviolacea S4047-1]